MSSYIKQPTVERLSTLMQQLYSGDLLVARFQRPYVWGDEQRVNLLDSIMRGMPIGSITVWRTATHHELQRLTNLDGLTLPAPSASLPYRQYILDGLQRMTTLYGALGAALYEQEPPLLDDTRSPLYIDLARTIESSEESRFVVVDQASTAQGRLDYEAKNPTMMPASVLLKHKRLGHFISKLLKHEDGERLSNRAENIADIFRDYTIPVIPLVLEDLSQVTLAFTRINTSGTPMSQLHMLNALTFLESEREQPPLMDRVTTFREDVMEQRGWGDLGDSAILQILRYLLGRGLYDDNTERMGEELRAKPEVFDEAFALIKRTIDVFASIHITSAGVLPYSIQFVLTACALHANDLTALDAQHRERLWLWTIATGLMGYFASITATRLREEQEHLQDILKPGAEDIYILPWNWYQPSLPQRFDWRAARCRAFLLFLVHREDDPKYREALAQHNRRLLQLYISDIYRIPENMVLAKLDPDGKPIPEQEVTDDEREGALSLRLFVEGQTKDLNRALRSFFNKLNGDDYDDFEDLDDL
jgi:hypothetical protein